MSAHRTNTTDVPRKSAGAFFRWEIPGEPIAVHIHLNVVDLLERDIVRGAGAGVAGVLLGRFERGRKLTLIVEDYESTPNVTGLGTPDAAFPDRRVLEELVEHWHSRPDKRMLVLGLYRSCPRAQASLNNDDLEISSSHSAEPERIFLLIEPQRAKASVATLYMVKDGAVAWTWHSIPFNRKELTENGAAFQSPIAGLQAPSPQLQNVVAPEKQGSAQRPENQLKTSSSVRWGLGIAATMVLCVAGILPLRGTDAFRALSASLTASDEPVALGLKLQRTGNDWQLSWDRSAPFLLTAAAGHLLIADGFIRKNVDLDISELRSGSVLYTPVTDDATLQLEIVDAESKTLANETVHIVAGLPPSPPDHLVPTIGGRPDTRVHAAKLISLASAPTPGIGETGEQVAFVESSIAGLPPAKAPIPLSMNPPAPAIGHKTVDFEATVTLQNPAMTLRGTDTLAPSLPPAPPELDSNPRGSNSNLPSSASPVSQTGATNTDRRN